MGASDPVPAAISAHPAALVILAAGASRRFGGQPKALLEVDGEAAVRRLARIGRSVGLEPIIVVVGRHRPGIESALGGEPVTIITNEDWERGRTGSIQTGLRAVSAGSDVVLWPVDHPFVEANTLHLLGASAIADPIATWVIPTYQGRGGHPVWLKPPAIRCIYELDPDTPFRSLLPSLGPQVLRVPTGDPWILVGTDTPDEYAAARSRRSTEG